MYRSTSFEEMMNCKAFFENLIVMTPVRLETGWHCMLLEQELIFETKK
jgi:hypothetical protein